MQQTCIQFVQQKNETQGKISQHNKNQTQNIQVIKSKELVDFIDAVDSNVSDIMCNQNIDHVDLMCYETIDDVSDYPVCNNVFPNHTISFSKQQLANIMQDTVLNVQQTFSLSEIFVM